MNFTGERFIPGEGGFQIAYEHLHRYFFALRWAENNAVLDLACGNGYGAALLASRARHVWALDIDKETIEEACRNWPAQNLSFLQGNATQLPFQTASIDLVVAMEILEHLEEQERLVQEISRVCSPNGVALISTPNKAEYSDSRNYQNPFHKRELYLAEFTGILKQHFPFVEIAGQQIRAGSLITCRSSASSCEVFEEAAPGAEGKAIEPMYYLALCSPDPHPNCIPLRSAFLDSKDGLFLEEKREIFRLGDWGKSLESIVAERDQSICDLQSRMKEKLDSRDSTIRDLQSNLASEVASRDRTILDLQNSVDLRDGMIKELQKEVASRDQTIRTLQEELQTEVDSRDTRILDLINLLHLKEKEFDERGIWALSLQAEVERLSQARKGYLYRILSRLRLLPR